MLKLAVVIALVAAVFCQSPEDMKIRKIWDDMDLDRSETLTYTELLTFAITYTGGSGQLDFYTFDYEFGSAYGDSRETTEYIFLTWDDPSRDGLLTEIDLMFLFQIIDLRNPLVVDLLDYATEFLPYFQNLYASQPHA